MTELLLRKRNKMKRSFKTQILSLGLFAAASAFSGCSAKSYSDELKYIDREPISLPFSFKVESFLDRRANKGEPTLTEVLNPRQTYPFKQNNFLKSLVYRINGDSLFEHDTATLRIELKDYAAFKDGLDYTTSFYVDITGFDVDGRVLATGVFSCFAKENISIRAVSGIRSIFQHDQHPKQEEEQIADAWKDLYEQCLNDIAYDFNAKVMEWHQRRG